MRRADRISAVVLLVFSVLLGREALHLNYWAGPQVPGPGFLPFWVAAGLMVGAVGVLVAGRRNREGDVAWFANREARARLLLLALLTTLLVFAVWPLGMLLAIGLYLLIFLMIFMPGRWAIIVTMAVVIPLAVHLIFERWLLVPLPKGVFGF
ncbi:MAG: tripartite tricarboxylate transporter TctB family protein [candidate division NC10 bacterium]